MPNGGTQLVIGMALPQVSHRPKCQDQGSNGPSWCSQEPRTLWHCEPCHVTDTHFLLSLPFCHGHTLSIVTDTHQHIDRDLYTYTTSYLAQAYWLSILIDNPTLFIDSWLIRLWVDNVLLINTRSLSIVIDKTIPLSIGIPSEVVSSQVSKHVQKMLTWVESVGKLV
jgi:hypothetical protein